MAFRGIQATNLISTETAFDDSLLVLNKSGTTQVDVGFLGRIGASSYAGLIKDSESGKFILIDSITLSSQTINDVSAIDASLVKGSLEVATITATAVHPTTTFVLPKGTAAQRPTNPVAAQMFFNTETNLFEGYDGTAWIQFIPATFFPATP
jgi:hypothetical protein|tara:strand:+ start:75 stop:530 length:456 start_codon:yes stop_codon:yes gene_type:complete